MAVDGNWNITMSTPMGDRNATLTPEERRRRADGHAGGRRQFSRYLRRQGQWRRRRLEGFHHQPDAADARLHRQGFRRQHFRRNGHRPDGQLSVYGDAGVRPLSCPGRGAAFTLLRRAGTSSAATDSNFKQPRFRILAARFARVLSCSFRPLSFEGAGNAGRPMRPIAACAMVVVERTRVSQVTPENARHSPRNGLRLIRDLPGDRLVDTVTGEAISASLTPAPRRQDHTTSPSASSAIRQRRRPRPPHPASRP